MKYSFQFELGSKSASGSGLQHCNNNWNWNCGPVGYQETARGAAGRAQQVSHHWEGRDRAGQHQQGDHGANPAHREAAFCFTWLLV